MAAAVHPMISIVIFTWRSPPAWWPYSELTVGGWGGERRALRRAGRGRSAERAAVGNLALGDCENDGAVFAGEAGHENLRLEARHAFRPQAGRTHHLTPDELIRLVERGELCARLSDPERSEVYPELVSRLAGFGKRLHSPDRPDTYSNTLEVAPGRNARGFSGHAMLAGPGSEGNRHRAVHKAPERGEGRDVRVVVHEGARRQRRQAVREIVYSKREREDSGFIGVAQVPVIRLTQVPRRVAAHGDRRSRRSVHAGIVGPRDVGVVHRDLQVPVPPVETREKPVGGQRAAESAARAGVVRLAGVLEEGVSGLVLEVEGFEDGAARGERERAVAIPRENVVGGDGVGAL